jgi:hypothetical protein
MDSSQVFVRVIDVACARDWHDDRFSRKQPGQGQLRGCGVLPLSKLFASSTTGVFADLVSEALSN